MDDNTLAAEALERWFTTVSDLTFVGFASDEASALSLAAARNPHVILLDLDMPGVDTLAMIPQFEAAVPHAKVVMLSGHISPKQIDRALDAGAMGYISKDEPTAIIASLARRAAIGEVVFSPLVQRLYLAG